MRPFLCLVLVLSGFACPARAQGLLQRARLETYGHPHSGHQAPIPSPEPLKSTSGNPVPGAGQGMGALAALAGAVATSPFWVPYVLLEDNLSRQAYFPGHPYARSHEGYLDDSGFRYGNGERSPLDPTYLKPFGVQTSLEDGHNFSGVNRLTGRLAGDTAWRFGLCSQWDHFFERYQGHSDELVLGDLNLTYRFAQADWVRMYAGLGGRGLFDRYRVRGGFNFLYGADVFLIDPVVLSTALDLGHLNQAFLLRLRTSVGVQLGHAELFAGYDWLRIGDVDIHGPMLGVRLWF